MAGNPEAGVRSATLRQCPHVVCILTKSDFYPAWRQVRDLDAEHLARAGVDAEILCVSSTLRIQALQTADRALNRESGFPALTGDLGRVGAEVDARAAREAAREAVAVADLLDASFRRERRALADPGDGTRPASAADESARARRRRDLDAEMARVGALRVGAQALAPEPWADARPGRSGA